MRKIFEKLLMMCCASWALLWVAVNYIGGIQTMIGLPVAVRQFLQFAKSPVYASCICIGALVAMLLLHRKGEEHEPVNDGIQELQEKVVNQSTPPGISIERGEDVQINRSTAIGARSRIGMQDIVRGSINDSTVINEDAGKPENHGESKKGFPGIEFTGVDGLTIEGVTVINSDGIRLNRVKNARIDDSISTEVGPPVPATPKEKFEQVLAQVPDIEPEERDRL
jgi:hypothetical protein